MLAWLVEDLRRGRGRHSVALEWMWKWTCCINMYPMYYNLVYIRLTGPTRGEICMHLRVVVGKIGAHGGTNIG